MKKAFKPEAVISLLAIANRVTNGALYKYYYLRNYHFSSALFYFRKAFISLTGNLHKNRTIKKEYFCSPYLVVLVD